MKPEYKKLLDKLSQKGKTSLFVVIGIVGIILITLGDVTVPAVSQSEKTSDTAEEYCQKLEKQVTELLGKIDGVGDVRVMITLESGEENIYVQQQKQTSDSNTKQNQTDIQQTSQNSSENEIVIISGQSGDHALVERTIRPVVQGVAVVCTGADDIMVVSAVTNTVAVVLNLPTNRIYVTKMR